MPEHRKKSFYKTQVDSNLRQLKYFSLKKVVGTRIFWKGLNILLSGIKQN